MDLKTHGLTLRLYSMEGERGNRYTTKKMLRIMKITAIILLSACLTASANGLGQRVTLSEKNAKLETVFASLKKQTGFDFFYKKQLLQQAGAVNIELQSVEFEDALRELFKHQPLSYRIIEKTVVITSKAAAVVIPPPPLDIKGRVVNDSGEPVIVTVQVKGDASKGVTTNENGYFEMKGIPDNAILVITGVSIETISVPVNGKSDLGTMIARVKIAAMGDVSVMVNTGYQQLPKERATGAFTQVSNETIERSRGINLLNRLEGLVSGFVVNRNLINGANNPAYSIRGRSTIFANANPLIILDGFPYEGTIDQINAADIESISLLKDAAASSIWGTRAGNGVIVITSKKGKKPGNNISFTSSITVGKKPDLYYPERLSSAEFIDIEQFLYTKGFYTSALNRRYAPVSPAVEIFEKKRLGQINADDSAAQIAALKNYDIRDQLNEYLYRPSVLQTYHVGYSGVTDNNQFYLSIGYDKNLATSRTDNYHRLTLNVNNNYALVKNKLDFTTALNISEGVTNLKSFGYVAYRPYDRIADENGHALPVVTAFTLRQGYVDTAGGGRLLDWSYRPKNEFTPNTNIKRMQYRFIAGTTYKPLAWLSLSANYQYLRETNKQEREESPDDFFARDIINRFSSITGGTVNRAVPLGEIFDQSTTVATSQTLRFQAGVNKLFGTDHELSMIAGYEGSDTRTDLQAFRLYGYNPSTKTNGNNLINPSTTYRYYYEPGLGQQLSTAPTLEDRANVSQSFFSNASYTYKRRYILSASVRKDESNLFGVKSNQKGVPLWSSGLAWVLSKESFYELSWLPSFKLRATYGYNGNVDKTLSAFLTVRNSGSINEWGSNYSRILNPPNPDLSWEKVQTMNIGVDFSLAKGILSGSIDVYRKHASNLIGNNPIAQQSGVSVFRGNGADMVSKGIEAIISGRIGNEKIHWSGSFVFNYNRDKVTNYSIKQPSNFDIIGGNYNNPLVGYPYYALFSYPSAGLNNTGRPQGYLNKVVSTDYPAIQTLLDPAQLIYHGSAAPTIFGNLLNAVGWKGLELSFNISYKLGYYFRRQDVFTGFISAYSDRMAGYQDRWQKPGDENHTRIPAFIYPQNTASANFFQYTEDLVEKGDHIRLQDIRLAYSLPRAVKWYKSAQVFIYGSNIGILWRSNKQGIDPDYGSGEIPVPFNASIGMNINF